MLSTTTRFAAVTGLVALTAAGCGLGAVTYDREFGRLDDSVSLAATGGLQPVEVLGAPPDGAAPEAVAEALRSPARYGETQYFVAPPGSGGLRLVLEFGKRVSSQSSCVSPSGARLEDRLVVSASLCRGDDLQSAASLVNEDALGPSDPRFADSMALLLRQVLTPEDKRRRIGLFREDD